MLFGHEEKIKIFQNLVRDNNLNHAYLFYGEPQVGKFTFAKSLAYFLEYGQFEILAKPLIDYQEILPNPERGSIGIDAVRQIKNFLFQKPFKSSRRLTVIDQGQALTDEAQGALLKIVEEPPANAFIIVIANESSVLLPPLLSRLMKVYFTRVSNETVQKILVDSQKISKDKAKGIAHCSFGRIGRALQILSGLEETKKDEESLEKYLGRKILELYLKDKIKNSQILKWLLLKEWQANAFNLNPNLQRKAVETKLNQGYTTKNAFAYRRF